VLYHLSMLGYTEDEATIGQIVAAVRARMGDRKGFALMDEDEFCDLVTSNDFKLQRLLRR
jgi:hypothetical protein